jgi:hypothetical protein
VKTKALLSTRAIARKIDIDPRTLLRLVAKEIVMPDYRAGNRLLFAEHRLSQLKAVVQSHRFARL